MIKDKMYIYKLQYGRMKIQDREWSQKKILRDYLIVSKQYSFTVKLVLILWD